MNKNCSLYKNLNEIKVVNFDHGYRRKTKEKRIIERLTAASGTQKLSALGFVLNAIKNDTADSNLDTSDGTTSSFTSNSNTNQ